MSDDRFVLSWHKSMKSAQSNCVEVAQTGEAVLVRDSKDRDGPVIGFAGSSWSEFLAAVHSGVFDGR